MSFGPNELKMWCEKKNTVNKIKENEPEKLNKLLKTDVAEVKKEQKWWQPHASHDSYTCQAFTWTRIQFFHHNNSDFKPRMLSAAGERCPVALFKCFCRAKTSTITWDGVPWVPEVFFSCYLWQKLSGEATIVTSGRKNPLVTAVTNLTSMQFWNKIACQTGF